MPFIQGQPADPGHPGSCSSQGSWQKHRGQVRPSELPLHLLFSTEQRGPWSLAQSWGRIYPQLAQAKIPEKTSNKGAAPMASD